MQELQITAAAPAPSTRAEAWAAAEAALADKLVSALRQPTKRQQKLAKAYGPYAIAIRWNAGKVLVQRATDAKEVWVPLVDHKSRGTNPGQGIGRGLYLDYLVQDIDCQVRQKAYLRMSPSQRPTAPVEFIFHGTSLEELEERRLEKAALHKQRLADKAWESAPDSVRRQNSKEEFIQSWVRWYPNIPYWLR